MIENLFFVSTIRHGGVPGKAVGVFVEKHTGLALKRELVDVLCLDVPVSHLGAFDSMKEFEAGNEMDDDDPIIGSGIRRECPLVVVVSPTPVVAPSLSPGRSWLMAAREEWRRRFQSTYRPGHALPVVTQLDAFIEQRLPQRIPLPASVSLSDLGAVSRELYDKLFITDTILESPRLVWTVAKPLSAQEHSEESLIAHWASLIQMVLQETLPNMVWDRGTMESSDPANRRPDCFCILNRVCVFRGQEASAFVGKNIMRREMLSDMSWIYGDAPYVFAYTTSGFDCDLLALTRGADESVETHQIASFNTSHVQERFRLLLALLQLARLFHGVVSRCPDTSRDELREVFTRRGSGFIVKSFPFTARWAGVGPRLQQVYNAFPSRNAPYVDSLVRPDLTSNAFVFMPRGVNVHPTSLDELYLAISHVLRALVDLHAAGWMHRQIRWRNVMKRRDVPNQWFLTNFCDAARSPCPNTGMKSLENESHAPELFVEGASHTTAIDIWAVGRLIEKREFVDEWFPEREFLHGLLADDPSQRPTAAQALAELTRLHATRQQLNP